ncbi:hypothetical protein [Streptomyces sp. E-08]|uniref:hypothetical protein n=1 Tax=Streptomyces sp. E-08 TaxID=3404047 RepID=UPI003CEB870D
MTHFNECALSSVTFTGGRSFPGTTLDRVDFAKATLARVDLCEATALGITSGAERG